jgi:hypothetical protein
MTTTLRSACVLVLMMCMPASGGSQDGAALAKLMYTDIDTGFTQVSLAEVVHLISQASGAKVVLLAESESRPSGIDATLTVDLPAAHRPALNLLQDALAACGSPVPCTWQVRNGMIEVSTKDQLSTESMQVTRILPIEEFIQPVPDYNDPPNLNLGGGGGGGGGGTGGGAGGGGGAAWEDLETRRNELIEVLIGNIEPKAWKRAGGTWAEIMPYRRSLLIRGPRWVQRQVMGFDFSVPRVSGRTPRTLRFEGDQVRVEIALSERLRREADERAAQPH